MKTQNTNNRFLKILNKKYDENFFADREGRLQRELDASGVLILQEFISGETLKKLQDEAVKLKGGAFRSGSRYNLYVLPDDPSMPENSLRNRKFITTKGCVPDDQIPADSLLRTIYDAKLFREFTCKLQNITEVFPYDDTLSSVNINYYDPGDNLEWHFDNADFVITLLVKQCTVGGVYEYAPGIRYTKTGEENEAGIRKIIDGESTPERARMNDGCLMIFRGKESLHRVTKVEKGNRVLVTLNYNTKPGVPLSEQSRMTFFGRTK